MHLSQSRSACDGQVSGDSVLLRTAAATLLITSLRWSSARASIESAVRMHNAKSVAVRMHHSCGRPTSRRSMSARQKQRTCIIRLENNDVSSSSSSAHAAGHQEERR